MLGNKGTAKKIAEVSGIDVQVVRNTLRRLIQKGLVKTYRPTVGKALIFPVIASVGEEKKTEGREILYELVTEIDEVFSTYKDSIMKWASKLGIRSIDEVRELIEKRKEEIHRSKEEPQ